MMRRRTSRQVSEVTTVDRWWRSSDRATSSYFLKDDSNDAQRHSCDGADPMAPPDLSRLNADERALFERLLLKIAGEFTGDLAPPLRQFVNTRAGDAV
jgi:hypothetical protein